MQHFDLVGVGFGPSNVALAIALQEMGHSFSTRFFESAANSRWQPNMLLVGSDIQNNPLRDLVTPRNPKSHYTFINYLKERGRLFDYLNLGIIYPLRAEYSDYIEWAAGHFSNLVSNDSPVEDIWLREGSSGLHARWIVETRHGPCSAEALVIGTGRSPNIPAQFARHLGARIFHLTDYAERVDRLARSQLRSIVVVGASQSAVEILLDLMHRFPKAAIHSVHRSFSMRQKDTSPFSDQVYFPDFVDYFFDLPKTSKSELQRQLRPTNYNSADIDVIHKLYLNIYEERLSKQTRFHLHNNTVVERVVAGDDGVQLELREQHVGRTQTIYVDGVILATGFKDIASTADSEPHPHLLNNVVQYLAKDNEGVLDIRRDYSVGMSLGLPLYLNGLCESSHGLGDAGSFSLLSLRASEIAGSLCNFFARTPMPLRRQAS